MPMSDHQLKYVSDDWQNLRARFLHSPMVEMEISVLAENAGISWSGPGADATPEEFLGLSFEQLMRHPVIGSVERTNLFLDILKETLAFDDPFSELVADKETGLVQSPVELNAEKLRIPLNFPLSLANISSDARKICSSEGLKTLGDLIAFSQRMARRIVIGNDFRELLNALVSADETTLARYLPVRRGSKGIHLPEAIGLGFSRLEYGTFLRMVQLYGGVLNKREEALVIPLESDAIERVQLANQDFIRRVLTHFDDKRSELSRAAESEEGLQAYLAVIGSDKVERVAFAELWKFFHSEYPARPGLFARILRSFRRR